MIEPILSSGFVKATAIIDVEKSLFDVLIVDSQCRRLADIKKVYDDSMLGNHQIVQLYLLLVEGGGIETQNIVNRKM